MSEIEKIEKEIRDVEDTYLKNAIYIISDYNNENKTRDDYKGRQIYELLQNADDCYTDTCNDIEVKFQLIDNYLIVQNTGKPFDARGITSLMHTDASSKYQNTIGCKGLGFRSVLNWANEINIVTKQFCVSFSEEAAKQKLKFYKEHSDKTHIDELETIDRIAILCSASVFYDEDIIGRYLENNFSTSIVLKCRPEYVEPIQQQLLELQFEELLFLKHIRTINIVSPATNRTIESIKEGETCYIQEKSSLTEWKIWEKQGTLTDANKKEKKYEIIVAYNTDRVAREKLRKSGFLYSFFRTDRKVNSYNCTINNHDLSPIVEVIDLDLAKMDKMIGRSAKKDIELLFEKLGIAEDFVDLSKEKIYEILLGLPDLDTSYLIGKKIYTQLNLFYKEDKLRRAV